MIVPAIVANPLSSESLDDPSRAASKPSSLHQEARRLVRLIQCPVCSKPFTDPVTLPCGRSLCRSCLNIPRERAVSTYPNLPSRNMEVLCFNPDCNLYHNLADCSHDVVLDKIARSIADIITARNSFGPGNHFRDFCTQSFSNDDPSRVLLTIKNSMGRLVDTYNLASLGLLNRDVEITYATSNADDSPLAQSNAAYYKYLTEMHILETNEQSTAPVDDLVLAELLDATIKELDCQVCYNVLLDPITTACGHTFCRTCLVPALDHSRACPACRQTVYLPPSLKSQPSNQTLNGFLMALCPDTIAARLASETANIQDNTNALDTPLFVIANAFPGCPMFLRIFEPRYRLMLSRALAGDRTFGVVSYNVHGTAQGNLGRTQFMQYGTLLHIEHAETMEDGTSFIEAKGISRFRVKTFGIRDNYFVGNVERVEDVSLAEEERLEIADTRGDTAALNRQDLYPGQTNIETMPTEALLQFGRECVNRMRARSETWLNVRILAIYGQPPEDAAIFPFWLASILPIDEPSKYELLKTTSVRQRLKISTNWILQFESRPRMCVSPLPL